MELGSDYIKFTGGPRQATRDRIHVTLNKKGLLYLNGKIYRQLGSPKAVQLSFSPTRQMIAMEPSEPDAIEAFPVKPVGPYHIVHASSFCRHFKIRINTTEKFIAPEIDANGVLHLDLRATVSVGGIRRKRRAK